MPHGSGHHIHEGNNRSTPSGCGRAGFQDFVIELDHFQTAPCSYCSASRLCSSALGNAAGTCVPVVVVVGLHFGEPQKCSNATAGLCETWVFAVVMALMAVNEDITPQVMVSKM